MTDRTTKRAKTEDSTPDEQLAALKLQVSELGHLIDEHVAKCHPEMTEVTR